MIPLERSRVLGVDRAFPEVAAATTTDFRSRLFPEIAAGGFSRLDGTVQFYNRVNALLRPDMVVLDFGAGRGAGLVENRCEYRRSLQMLRGKVARVVGVDVDPAVRDNPGLDEARLVAPDDPLPFEDGSVDLVLADFVFEHIEHPERCARELDRILRPGGWVCARTPNRWNYVAVAARLIPESLHGRVLGRVQPERKREDVFPAFYRMNDRRTLRRLFPAPRWRDCSYCMSAEPAYLPRRTWVWRTALFVDALLPAGLQSNILVFLQKLPSPSS